MPDPPALTTHIETFTLNVELQWQGGTFAEFETNFREFHWQIPHVVWFSDTTSGLSAHLALNFFETALRAHGSDIAHIVGRGILELHDDPNHPLDIGAAAAADIRVLRLRGASVFLGMEATVMADPVHGGASISVSPTFSLSFGGTTGD